MRSRYTVVLKRLLFLKTYLKGTTNQCFVSYDFIRRKHVVRLYIESAGIYSTFYTALL